MNRCARTFADLCAMEAALLRQSLLEKVRSRRCSMVTHIQTRISYQYTSKSSKSSLKKHEKLTKKCEELIKECENLMKNAEN
jgi:hypothetical protein